MKNGRKAGVTAVRQVAISGSGERLSVALLENERLVEWRCEGEQTEVAVGEIFVGQVADVLPAIQSAFVQIGMERNAYLYVDDVREPTQHPGRKTTIRERVREGEKLLVQVIKEGSEHKAPKVTTKLSLQGRYLVLLPYEKGISMSRKMADPHKRERLQELLAPLLADDEGVIVRTEAFEADEQRLLAELGLLRRRWQEIQKLASQQTGVGRIRLATDWLETTLRELVSADVAKIWVEDAAAYQKVKETLAIVAPEGLAGLSWYREKEPMFARLGIEAQLQQAVQRQVKLPSGGFLIFDKTEAMTVIDVNTGAFTGKGGQQREQAVTQTNLEAAAQIAAQLRLREIGGIIVIDFIDMKEQVNKERVLTALKRELAKDPVPATVLGMTALGLVEMTRKRVRPSLAERLFIPCDACRGKGLLLSPQEVAFRLYSEVTSLSKVQEAEAVLVELPTRLFHHIDVDELAWPARVYKLHRPALLADEYRILYLGSEQEAKRLYTRQTQIT
ncbi:MAG TPA: Rne/Rng family ribonuclease [Brevibacillus sp.]|nr:Rne/Rng family ribonuclease [Brevibacillus sp.]